MLAKLHLERDRPCAWHRHSWLSHVATPMTARDALAPVDPLTQPPELGAFLALVKGSVVGCRGPAIGAENVRRGAPAQPGDAGRGGRAQALHRASASETQATPRISCPLQPVCAPLSAALPMPANSPMPWSPAWSPCARPSICGESTTIIAGMDPEQQKVIYLQACPARGDRRPSGPCRIRLREGRGGQDRRASSRGPIRARCSIPALPRSPRTMSTRCCQAEGHRSLAPVGKRPAIAGCSGSDRRRSHRGARRAGIEVAVKPAQGRSTPQRPSPPPKICRKPNRWTHPPGMRRNRRHKTHRSCRGGRAAGRLWRRARRRGAASRLRSRSRGAAGTRPGLIRQLASPRSRTRQRAAATASDTPVDANDLTGQMVADTRKKLEDIDKLLKDTAQ